MSIVQNQNHRYWEDVATQLRCKRFTFKSCALKEPDIRNYSDALLLWAISTTEVNLSLGSHADRGDTKRWILSIARYPVDEVAQSLKTILNCLRIYYDSSFYCDYTGFKHQCNNGISGLIMSIIRPTVEEFLRTKGAVPFRIVSTFACFITKVNLETVKLLHSDTLLKYQQLEENYPSISDSGIIPDMRDVITEWMKPIDLGEIIPRHSGGATAECSRLGGKRPKYEQIEASDRLAFWANHYDYGYKYNHISPPARLITVPKGLDKRRLISPEPTLNQYWQQAILDRLDRVMRSIPQIKIHDQQQNRQLALSASYNRAWGTIDLSSASDLVSWKLVSQVFRGNIKLLQALYCTRSQYAQLDSKGTVIPLQKFAPMGSALCFPIESLIFASICEAWNRRKGIHYMYSVYGDDIICHETIFNEVLTTLEGLGFSVNLDKTFDPYCGFKESCGIEAVDGLDVTPVRLPRNFTLVCKYEKLAVRSAKSEYFDPSKFGALMTLANRLYDYGFVETRNYVVKSILSQGLKPFFGDSLDKGIYSPNPDNWHAKHRYNTDLQREEVLVDCISQRSQDNFDEINYYDRLCYMAISNRSSLLFPDDRIISSVDPKVTKVRKRWVSYSDDFLPNDNRGW